MPAKVADRHLIIGLPEAGKTSFLAALWHVVDSDEIEGALRIKEVIGDQAYLNKIRERWVSCKPLQRTKQEEEEFQLLMRLTNADGNLDVEIGFPDLSGESFKGLWEDRGWPSRYDELARAANGALMFIHPNKVIEPQRISEIPVPDEPEDEEIESGDYKNWESDDAPTQVKLVEFLQFLTHDPSIYPLQRVAVIISAWDAVNESVTPSQWLERRLPLLHQYLIANREKLISRVYGLSAQAGDLSDLNAPWRNYLQQAKRIEIIGEDCLPHDITAPIKWLMKTNE